MVQYYKLQRSEHSN